MSRKIDALVAEHVMGWYQGDGENGHLFYYYSDGLNMGHINDWRPSTDIAKAWSVLPILHKELWFVKISQMQEADPNWISYEVVVRFGQIIFESKNDNPAMAICLAALKAKGVEVDD